MATFLANEINATDRDVTGPTEPVQIMFPLKDKNLDHKNYNFLACNWFKNVLFSTNSLAKLLLDSLLSDSLISLSHSKMLFKVAQNSFQHFPRRRF